MRGMTFEYLFAVLGEDMAKWRKNALEEVHLMRTRLLSGPMKGVDQVGIDQLKGHLARAAKCRKDVADATQKLFEDASREMKPAKAGEVDTGVKKETLEEIRRLSKKLQGGDNARLKDL